MIRLSGPEPGAAIAVKYTINAHQEHGGAE